MPCLYSFAIGRNRGLSSRSDFLVSWHHLLELRERLSSLEPHGHHVAPSMRTLTPSPHRNALGGNTAQSKYLRVKPTTLHAVHEVPMRRAAERRIGDAADISTLDHRKHGGARFKLPHRPDVGGIDFNNMIGLITDMRSLPIAGTAKSRQEMDNAHKHLNKRISMMQIIPLFIESTCTFGVVVLKYLTSAGGFLPFTVMSRDSGRSGDASRTLNAACWLVAPSLSSEAFSVYQQYIAMMSHGQDVPNYTSQGRCAQSTPPCTAPRRPTLTPVTEVPSEFQYYHNMSLVVSPHPGAENYTTAAPAQSRRPAIVDAWSNPTPYQSAPIGWRELALSTTRIRPSVDTTFGMLDMISSAFTPPGRNSLHESCSIEMPNFMPLADCSRGPAMREVDETSLFRQEVGSEALVAASLRRRIDPSRADRADHRCKHCGRSFTRVSTCREHVLRHRNRREFQCTEAATATSSLAPPSVSSRASAAGFEPIKAEIEGHFVEPKEWNVVRQLNEARAWTWR
ncbi:hypothetical protein K523DRAFT_359852, partial [Schizophyllum commune Tattone D]